MAKNSLQELCQKRGYGIPKYSSSQTGSHHQPVWVSSVETNIPEGSAIFHTNEGHPTKKGAEEDAAYKALSCICSEDASSVTISTAFVKYKTVLLVDVENLPKLISQLPLFVGPMDIMAFVGEHHPLSETDFGPHVVKIISPSTRPDGTDSCLQVCVGFLLAKSSEYDMYLIATRDHFGSSLVDMITSSTLMWKKKSARVVSTLNQILNAIS